MATIAPQQVLDHEALRREGADWSIERCFPFFNFLYVHGWFEHPESMVEVIAWVHDKQAITTCNFEKPLEDQPGARCHFTMQALLPEGAHISDCSIIFKLANGRMFRVPFEQIPHKQAQEHCARAEGDSPNPAHNQFFEELRAKESASVIEVGSRARSGLSRRPMFKGMDYVGVDIMDGENVDIVGDAHTLSESVGRNRFDGLYTVSTYEHLIMPWKAAIEANRVLKPGGLIFIHTHQCLGMHDEPWDFWRFSDTAWYGLFNAFTGFEIVKTHLGEPMHIVPTQFHAHWEGYEGALGFATSSVLARKIGETEMTWDVPTREIAVGFYPE